MPLPSTYVLQTSQLHTLFLHQAAAPRAVGVDRFPKRSDKMSGDVGKELDRLFPLYKAAKDAACDQRNSEALQTTSALQARQFLNDARKLVDEWKSGGVKTTLQEGAATIRADQGAVQSIEAAVEVLKDSLEARKAHQLLIADLLDLDPAEIETPDNDEPEPQSQNKHPDLTEDEKVGIAALVEANRHPGFVSGEFLAELTYVLQELSQHALVHEFPRGPVSSRPKLVFGVPNPQNPEELGLYTWKQKASYYGTIDVVPPVFAKLLNMISSKFPDLSPEHFPNHVMLTFMKNGRTGFIPTHQDQSFSKHNTDQFEVATPIWCLNFLQERAFVITDLNAPVSHSRKQLEPHIITEFSFGNGEMIVFPPGLNGRVKHAVPSDASESLRVSIVLRRCDRMWVNPTAGYWTENGDKTCIANVKTKDGQKLSFVMQPPFESLLVPEPMMFRSQLLPPPVLDSAEVQALFMTDAGNQLWDWGSQYKGFSDYANLPWWVIAVDRQYVNWIIKKPTAGKPPQWQAFLAYCRTIEESNIYQSLNDSFNAKDPKYNYLLQSAMKDEFYAHHEAKRRVRRRQSHRPSSPPSMR